MKRSHIGMMLSMFAVFGSGILVGAFGYHSYSVKAVKATVEAPVKLTPEEWRKKYIAEMRSRLNLQDKQVTDLHAILDDTRSRFKGLKERHKQESDQLKTEQTERVRAMLNPTQLVEYEKFRQEREQRMKAEQAAREQAAKAAKAGN